MLWVVSCAGLLLIGACNGGDPGTEGTETSTSTTASSPATVTTTDLAGESASTTTTVPVTKVFDADKMQDDVRDLLTGSYEVEDVQSVSCPAHQEVRAGNTFDCDVTISGDWHTVTITVNSDDGHYEVGAPEPK